MGLNDKILVISDTHFPYEHPDCIQFLKALNKKHRFTRVIHIGDEIDSHGASFHEKDPDLYSAGHELSLAVKKLKPLYDLFPAVDVLDSNHGALFRRKIKHHQLPSNVLKSNQEILEAPAGWRWFDELIIKLPTGQKCLFFHGKNSDPLKVSKALGVCTVNGHFHTQFSIQKWSSPVSSNWSMVVGCLIDPKSRAYYYQKNDLLKPVIGCGMILNGIPRLELMQMDKEGRWTGKIS